jgi:segregation and condensation protein A
VSVPDANTATASTEELGPAANAAADLAAAEPAMSPTADLAAAEPAMSPTADLAAVGLSLDVFEGPFDLLITLILNQEVDLLEVNLAEIVLAYIERLEARDELDLEAATEFLVLIAALLELKSRLMLPGEDTDGLDLEPQEAVEELLARLLEYKRFRNAAEALHERLASEQGFRYRSAPLPPELRHVTLDAASQAYEPSSLAEAVAGLLREPPAVDTRHLNRITVSFERRLAHLRELLSERTTFTFDEAVAGEDRMTQAVTLFALLELYKGGELTWRQREPFGPIEIAASEEAPAAPTGGRR